MESATDLNIRTMAQMMAAGQMPEVLFWVGCAGSFDDRAKKITKAFVRLMNHAGVSFAVLGTEEGCTGDPAKRAGNEFLFQMQAMTNIQVLNGYGVRRVVTACPHCFNTLKNEYPALGGDYDVMHHSQFLQLLLDEGRLKVQGGAFKGKRITYHDPCYLGRANDVYEAPRQVIARLDGLMVEMKRSRANGLCCGAGGAQMFKEAEPGNQEVNVARTEDVVEVQPNVVAAACPFCMTMLRDGVTLAGKYQEMEVLDIAELIARAADL
jgi:Fe-S oxidoreductase